MAEPAAGLLSPRGLSAFSAAYIKRIVQAVEDGQFQVILHNCGNNRTLMDQFIEAGVECYQSLQTIPDMELGALKRDFGEHMTFWGGIALEVLLTGTPERNGDLLSGVLLELEVQLVGFPNEVRQKVA